MRETRYESNYNKFVDLVAEFAIKFHAMIEEYEDSNSKLDKNER